MSNAFDSLAPFIQEFIYRSGWQELRDVQAEAIRAILDTPNHVLITSGTASGKTEAAFFPILTQLWQAPPASFGVIYVGPLKALINDQFERITGLIEEAEVPLYAWHGDRSTAEKARALKHPRGVLQITPESLEALLMNHADQARPMFCDLRFIVIDELHALMGTDRGLQLQCLMTRLERLIGHGVRRVGLSATIQDASGAGGWLAAGTAVPTTLVASAAGGRQLNLSLRHDTFPADEACAAFQEQRARQMDALYQQVADQKCLVFTNSRMEAERIASALSEAAAQRGEPDIYRVHHGSLSASLREETESVLRDSDRPAVVTATQTLEMGIDLGRLDKVVQLGAPTMCSSFVQRLGRAGRRGTPAIMRFFTSHAMDASQPFGEMPWELLQTIAVIQLYLEERWIEDVDNKPCPFSVLFHQTLAHLMTTESTGRELAQAVLTLPPFQRVDPADYRCLLDHMLATSIIEKTESGTLIPGLAGEKLAGTYRFYSVFHDRDGYRVLHQQHFLGEIDDVPEAGHVILLAGRAWQVSAVDAEKRCVYVSPCQGSGKRQWQSGGSGATLDDRIVAKMQQILQAEETYPYLQPEACQALQAARMAARAYDLDGCLTALDHDRFLFHPWLGGKKLATLHFLLRTALKKPLCIQRMQPAGPIGYCITSAEEPKAWLRKLLRAIDALEPNDIMGYVTSATGDRYDVYLPESLRKKAFVYNQMDLNGLKAWGRRQWSEERG